MHSIDRKKLRAWSLMLALAFGGMGMAAAQQPVAAPTRALPDFADLAEQVGPAVVGIRTLERARPGNAPSGNMDEDMQEFFRRFFGQPMPNPPGRQGPRPNRPQPDDEQQQSRGLGSGFILTPDGFVMTNAHVIDGADEVIVTLTDKRELKARIVGLDKRTDVAVVKIEATGLPTVRVGDVGRLRVGEWVLAIGSPFGLESSVTAGIVSAKQRDTGDYLPLIQTDVAINPGNSGGPLINMRGEVVGINSQIYSRSGGYMGISFAIPIDEAIRVSDQLRVAGRVTRGRVGVQIDQVTKDVAESIGLGKPMGAFVRSVESGSPADKAGVEAGDIITKFDGKVIDRATDLQRLVGNTKPGARATLTVFRKGASRDLNVTVAEFEPEKPIRPAAAKESDKPKSSPAAQSVGLAVSDLTEAQKKELKIKGGVKVEGVSESAARAGIREGDIIVQIGNVDVNNVREFDAALARVDKSKAIPVLLRRGELASYLVIRPARG
ncbi:DegQ family serine endoprotease [Ramlibacter solisilvae]|uniref:Probable periplasmic serine endoprotease DegP-like n=1 Tax=Ramlibacter tataouinensis TaxID=94132 RepID=A0A127JPZ5_9BURK|nr:DegQ family serine endoprotease [Ramlibacter tataouinensis]AMO22104.1 serine peptidase [Ramlibacter tataouinensis]